MAKLTKINFAIAIYHQSSADSKLFLNITKNKTMKNIMCNVGSTDKKIRIGLGLIIFISLFAMESWFWLLGLIPLVTGLLDFCPIYAILGISTCKVPTKWWQ
jgi:hypothetical protein